VIVSTATITLLELERKPGAVPAGNKITKYE
jgi:hypothetical protein